jgi:hypothetical protein
MDVFSRSKKTEILMQDIGDGEYASPENNDTEYRYAISSHPLPTHRPSIWAADILEFGDVRVGVISNLSDIVSDGYNCSEDSYVGWKAWQDSAYLQNKGGKSTSQKLLEVEKNDTMFFCFNPLSKVCCSAFFDWQHLPLLDIFLYYYVLQYFFDEVFQCINFHLSLTQLFFAMNKRTGGCSHISCENVELNAVHVTITLEFYKGRPARLKLRPLHGVERSVFEPQLQSVVSTDPNSPANFESD